MAAGRVKGRSELGRVCGEYHGRAKLTDREVELIRQLREAGGMTLQALAEKFEVGKSTIFDIVSYRKRPAAYASWAARKT